MCRWVKLLDRAFTFVWARRSRERQLCTKIRNTKSCSISVMRNLSAFLCFWFVEPERSICGKEKKSENQSVFWKYTSALWLHSLNKKSTVDPIRELKWFISATCCSERAEYIIFYCSIYITVAQLLLYHFQRVLDFCRNENHITGGPSSLKLYLEGIFHKQVSCQRTSAHLLTANYLVGERAEQGGLDRFQRACCMCWSRRCRKWKSPEDAGKSLCHTQAQYSEIVGDGFTLV